MGAGLRQELKSRGLIKWWERFLLSGYQGVGSVGRDVSRGGLFFGCWGESVKKIHVRWFCFMTKVMNNKETFRSRDLLALPAHLRKLCREVPPALYKNGQTLTLNIFHIGSIRKPITKETISNVICFSQMMVTNEIERWAEKSKWQNSWMLTSDIGRLPIWCQPSRPRNISDCDAKWAHFFNYLHRVMNVFCYGTRWPDALAPKLWMSPVNKILKSF